MTSTSTPRLTASRLSISKDQLAESARTVGLGPVQSDALWADLVARVSAPTRSGGFTAADVFWYLGAGIVLVAMGWLATIVTTTFGTGALLATALVYMALFTVGGWMLAAQRDLRVPGGLLYSLATVMVPIAVASGADYFGWRFDNHSLAIPFAALFVVGLLYTATTRISLVAFPALLAGWLALVANLDWFSFGSDSWNLMSIGYGLALIAFSFLFDLAKTEEDYAGWGYLVGAIAAFTGFTFMGKGGEMGYALYALGGCVSMLASVLLSRKIFAFGGAAAVLIWVGHLSIALFANSWLAPFVVVAIGIATIFVGVYYQRHHDEVDEAILGFVPPALRAKLPRR